MPHASEAASPAMQTEASKTRSLEIAFLVDEESLRRLEKLLREIGDSLEYQVKFSDGHTLQFRNIEEVLKLPNTRTRSIVSLISGVTGRAKRSAYVVLKDPTSQPSKFLLLGETSSDSPSVEYTINGTQRDVIFLGDKLDEWTVEIRQWYSIFNRGVFLLVLFAAAFYAPIWLWDNASPQIFSQAFLKSHDWLQLVSIIALWVGEYWLLKLLPRTTFAIGQGVKRHQFFVYLRRGVLGAFVLSVLAKWLVNWLTRQG